MKQSKFRFKPAKKS